MKTHHLLVISLLLFAACSKNKKMCTEFQVNPPYMEAPGEVYERDTIKISLKNMGNSGKSYALKFPDMAPFNYQTFVGDIDGTWYVYGAQPKHEGFYTFSFNDHICGDFKLSKYVTVKPLPTPCFDDIAVNTMLIRDSATGVENTANCEVSFHNVGGYSVSLNVTDPQLYYELKVGFVNDIPDKSCTLYLKNYYENAEDQNVPDNNEIQAYIYFYNPLNGSYSYRLIPLSEDLYVKREGNQVTLTLCGARFKSYTDVVYITAKIVFTV